LVFVITQLRKTGVQSAWNVGTIKRNNQVVKGYNARNAPTSPTAPKHILGPTKRPAALCAPAKGLELVDEGFAGVKPVKVGVNVIRGVLAVDNPSVGEADPATAPPVPLAPVMVKGLTLMPPALQLFVKSVWERYLVRVEEMDEEIDDVPSMTPCPC
jgi:hypothetical protein